jgi:4-amino-4-deoxy-L-arabinose transferase-like glycosyltransferase
LKKLTLSWKPGADAAGLAEPTEAKWRFWMLAILALIGPPVLFFLYYRTLMSGLINADALDFAQLGRNLQQGRGFSTEVLRPLAMGDSTVTGSLPDTTHGPLYPFLLAIAFGLAGANDMVVAAVSGAFYGLTVLAVYMLGRRMFTSHIGAMAALLVAVNVTFLEFAVSGLHITLYIFLATWLMLAAYNVSKLARNASENPGMAIPAGRLVLLGILTSLLYLTDPLFAWAIPVVLIGMLFLKGGSRVRNFMFVLVPICLLVLPWMIRNGALTGNPVFGLKASEIWMYTANQYPGDTGYRLAPSEVAGSDGLLRAIIKKYILGIGSVIQGLPQFSSSWVLVFFLPALLLRLNESAASNVRRLLMISFVTMLLTIPLFGVQALIAMPMFTCLVPTALVFSIAYVVFLVQQSNVERTGRIALSSCIAAAVAYPILAVLVFGLPRPEAPGKAAAVALKQATTPADACLTDQPWTVAWYAGRRAVWAPKSPQTLRKVRDNVSGLRWMVATSGIAKYSREWEIIHKGLAKYNEDWYAAVKTKRPQPPTVVLNTKGLPSDQYPLLEALTGFYSVRPVQGQEIDTVVAVAPTTAERIGLR